MAVAEVDMQAIWAELLQEESPSGRAAGLQYQWQQEVARPRGEQVAQQLEVCLQLTLSFTN